MGDFFPLQNSQNVFQKSKHSKIGSQSNKKRICCLTWLESRELGCLADCGRPMYVEEIVICTGSSWYLVYSWRTAEVHFICLHLLARMLPLPFWALSQGQASGCGTNWGLHQPLFPSCNCIKVGSKCHLWCITGDTWTAADGPHAELPTRRMYPVEGDFYLERCKTAALCLVYLREWLLAQSMFLFFLHWSVACLHIWKESFLEEERILPSLGPKSYLGPLWLLFYLNNLNITGSRCWYRLDSQREGGATEWWPTKDISKMSLKIWSKRRIYQSSSQSPM